MIILFLLILLSITTNDGSHFNGGTITWAPVYPNSTSSSVLITVTQSYSWVYPTVNCATNIPTTGASTYLTCVSNCSTAYGFTNTTISILTDCTSFSASLGLVFSSRSVNITLNGSTYFWIAYRGQAWRSLANAATNGSATWSVVSLIDLQRRPDGLINTPPVAQIASPQYVIINTTTAIKIPVSDVNTGDDLRCRCSSSVDECADVCTVASTTNLTTLSNCTLTFTATKSGVWYAIALQVEDFINTTSTTPMSSVAVQFLIYVLTPNCSQVPVIIPLTGCLDVQVNVPVTFTLYAMNYCNRTQSIITDLLPTIDITGMNVSSLVNSTTNTSLVYVTLTWIPQASQIGSQQFCAVAYTSEKVQSNPYCVTFNVLTSQPCPTTTTSTTSTVTTTTITQTTSITSATTTTTTASTSTSATSTTATTTTTSTSTSATSTTVTTATTTSVTSITQTTTITSNSSQINIPLIVGISLLALLIILGCCSFWLYYLNWSASAHRRRLNQIAKGLQYEIDTLYMREDKTNIRPNKRSKNYIADGKTKKQETGSSFLSDDPIEPMPTPAILNKRINSTNTVKVNKVVRLSKEENTSVQSYHPRRHSDANTSSVEKQSRSRHSSITVSTMKRSSNTAEMIEANSSNKSTILHHEKNEISSASTAKVHVVKVLRNKVSASPKTCMNISSAPAGIRKSQSATDNINSDAKLHSAYIQEVQHPSSPKTKDIRSPRQQRTTIFSHVAVNKIKRLNN